jgi:hypothetical protein
MRLVNPMLENRPAAADPAPRLATLQGKRIALLDISKPGGRFFLDRVEQLLRERYGVADVSRQAKPTFTKPAPAPLIHELRAFDAVIEGLAD